MSAVKNQLIIGDGSCVGDESCFQIKSSTNRRNRDKDTIIGDGSCAAPNACSNFQGVSIGSNSCNCEGCCSCFATGELPDEIPSDSCDVRGECCSTDAPSMVPSSQPSAMPTTPLPVFDLPLSECKTVGSTTFIAACLSGPDILSDPNSPQSQALQWILDSPEVGNWDGLELSQRYVLGIFFADSFYGLGDEDTPVCDTYDVDCNADKEIVRLVLEYEPFGTLPREIGALTALQYLDVFGNGFTGPIPSEIGLLTQLTRADFEHNRFTGTIPTSFGQLTALALLYLSLNQISGTIPTSLGQLTLLTKLSLNNDLLTGTIPTELAQLTALTTLWLDDNQLTGTIPVALTQLLNLSSLFLKENNLTGQVPSEFCDKTKFPDWRADGYFGGEDLWADCMGTPEVQCDCCDRCYDESGNCLDWNGSEFVPGNYC